MSRFTIIFGIPFSVGLMAHDPSNVPLHGEWNCALNLEKAGEQQLWHKAAAPFGGRDKIIIPHSHSVGMRLNSHTGTAWCGKDMENFFILP